MDIQVRKANKTDLSSILGLYSEPDIDNGKILDLTSAELIFNKMQTYPNYNLYVAIFNNKIVGTFELLIMDNLAHLGAPSGIIEDVVVRSEYRGQGIGKKMMVFAIDECKKAGCYKLMLSSSINRNLAHKFYTSLNFERHGYSFQISINK